MATSVTPAQDSRQTALAIDNLLRRELKVGDPRDPAQLARALRERYQGNRRADAIDGEARGLPFLQTPLQRPLSEPAPAALDQDLAEVRTRIRDDLAGLIADPLTSTLRPELEGWQTAIGSALDEGFASARLGLDPGRRDIAFGARRQLGEYARLARLVGLFSPALNAQYRALATSLDDAATVMLVMVGDAMANLGMTGGRFLLKTAYSELQARRDTVLTALRRIDGIGGLSGGSSSDSHWPRGLRAHRQLNLLLEARGQGELRSLLHEPELARTMDELIQLAGGGTPQGLRTIGSTAWAPLARMRRFVRTVGGLVDPASHELTGLVEALRLFVEGFQSAGGFRLLRVARPALMSQTGGGLVDETPADRRLVALTQLRPAFADQVESWMPCCGDLPALQAQAALDRVLFDMDRAIDAYATGSAEIGLCEVRASAMHLLTQSLVENAVRVNGVQRDTWPGRPGRPAGPPGWVTALRQRMDGKPLRNYLVSISGLVRPVAGGAGMGLWRETTLVLYDRAFDDNLAIAGEDAPQPRFAQLLHDEIANGLDADDQWVTVLRQMATDAGALQGVIDGNTGLIDWQDSALAFIHTVSGVAPHAALPNAAMPPHFEVSLERMAAGE